MILVLDRRGFESPLYRRLERRWSELPKRTAKQRRRAARASPVVPPDRLSAEELRTLLGRTLALAVGSMTEAQQSIFMTAVESGMEVIYG